MYFFEFRAVDSVLPSQGTQII